MIFQCKHWPVKHMSGNPHTLMLSMESMVGMVIYGRPAARAKASARAPPTCSCSSKLSLGLGEASQKSTQTELLDRVPALLAPPQPVRRQLHTPSCWNQLMSSFSLCSYPADWQIPSVSLSNVYPESHHFFEV